MSDESHVVWVAGKRIELDEGSALVDGMPVELVDPDEDPPVVTRHSSEATKRKPTTRRAFAAAVKGEPAPSEWTAESHRNRTRAAFSRLTKRDH